MYIFERGLIMKKIIASTLAVVVFNIFSPVAPLAYAGIIENQQTQAVAQDASAARIQQLLTVKTQLEQGNKQGLVESLSKAALDQLNQGDAASIATALSQGNLSQETEDALRQQVGKGITDRIAPYQKGITDRLAPYEKQVAVITTLFNN